MARSGTTTTSVMARTLDAGPITASHRSAQTSSARTTSGGGVAAPGIVSSRSSANVALTRRPRTPGIMSFEGDGENEVACVDLQASVLRQLYQSAVRTRQCRVEQLGLCRRQSIRSV